jgi:hypothetical protein
MGVLMDRMYQVIVVGGIALVANACGGDVSTSTDGGGSDAANMDEFPSELPSPTDGGVLFDGGSSDANVDSFPSELPVSSDAPYDAGARDAPIDGFPSELPVRPDA